MPLRIIGDVHAQVDFSLRKDRASYLEIIAGCSYSVQIGDMGDAEAYDALVEHVDSTKHRFFGGNHDHYPFVPSHHLGDFGFHSIGGVDFFFVRGAKSSDKKKLLETGERLGRTLWYPEEELPVSTHDAVIAVSYTDLTLPTKA